MNTIKDQMDLSPKALQDRAHDILIREVEGWGSGKAKYPVSPEDMNSLLEGGAVPLTRNHDNGDGTFLTEVTFEGLAFTTSSKHLL